MIVTKMGKRLLIRLIFLRNDPCKMTSKLIDNIAECEERKMQKGKCLCGYLMLGLVRLKA